MKKNACSKSNGLFKGLVENFLHVGHHVQLHVGHHDIISMLCEGSETLLEWKSESTTDGPTNGHTVTDGAGAADACASKYLEAA